MVSNSGKKSAQEDQMKLIYIKKVQACQAGNPHFTTLFVTPIFVYHSYKLYKQLTQYTSYEVTNIAVVGQIS
jgi:hypothetical protein